MLEWRLIRTSALHLQTGEVILWIQLPLNNTYNTFTEIQLPLDNVYFQSTHNTSATAITFADAITTQHSPAADPGNLQKSSPTLSRHLIGKQCYIEQCHQIEIFCQCRIVLDTVCKWTCILMHLCSPAGVRNPSVEHVMLLGAAAISWRLPPSLPSGEDPSLPPSLPLSIS